MGDNSSKPTGIFAELKRRRVFRVAAVYGAVAWLLVEVTATVAPLLTLPDWTPTLVLVLVLVGFPLALVFAWAFDVTPAGVRRTANRIAAVGGALVLALGGVAFVLTRGPAGPPLVEDRVVVAPFVNQTGDPTLDPVGSMAADWITQGLVRTGVVQVVPTTVAVAASNYVDDSASARPAGDDRIRAIANETGAAIVVSGAFYRQGESIQFQARIVDAREMRLLEAPDAVTAPADAPQQALVEVRQRVMGALATRLNERLRGLGIGSEPPRYEAYRAFAQGLERFMGGDYVAAIERFDRAIHEDSTFITAHHMAAIAHLNLGQRAHVDSITRALADRRGEMAPDQVAQQDWLEAYLRGDLAAQARATERMAALAPASAWVYQAGFDLNRLNRPREALDRYLLELDPDAGAMRGWRPYWSQAANACHMLGEHERELDAALEARERHPELRSALALEIRARAALGEAERVMALLDEALALPPDGSWTPARIALWEAALEFDAHGTPDAAGMAVEYALDWLDTRPADERETIDHRLRLCLALMIAGRDAEALEIARELMAANDGSSAFPMYVGVISARLGDRAEAERMDSVLQRMELPYDPGLVTFRRAQLAAQMGERGRAMTLLRRAFAEGLAYGPDLHVDPRLKPLRDHPPFQELLEPDG